MKRIYVILLAFCLVTCASPAAAETVREQVNAPAAVQDAFASNTGKTTVTIDARVNVPDAEAMYIIPVTSIAFDDALVPKLTKLIWPGLENKKVEVEEGNSICSVEGRGIVKGFWCHSAGITRNSTRNDDIYVHVDSSYHQVKDMEGVYNGALCALVQYDARYRVRQTINYNSSYMDNEVTGEGIEGHPLTSAQAVEIGQSLIEALTDEPFELFSVGQAPGIIYDDERILAGTHREGTGYSYALAFTRKVMGAKLLPCYYAFMNSDSWRDDLYTLPVNYEQILIAINREGQVTSFMWHNPYAYGEAGEAQTFMPFERVLSVARQMLPLKYQWMEAYGGTVSLRVNRIELGYMALLQRDKQNFALTPVWNFYGNYDDSANNIRSSVLPLLTVNATDGTVVDIEYGY